MQILIIEDDETFSDQLITTLRDARYVPVAALTEKAAKEILQQQAKEIQVAIVDMFLGLDREAGLNLIRLMRKQYPQIVSIVLTGNADMKNAADCIRAGAFSYLLKDMCPLELLLQTVQQAIAQYALLRGVDELDAKCKKMQELMRDFIETLQRSRDERNRV